jgi:hypothetical protein
MKSRWIVNLLLLALVLGIGAFIKFRPQQEVKVNDTSYEVSTLKLGAFTKLSIEFPAKAGLAFEKKDGYWYLSQPYKARADQMMVQRIISLVGAKSTQKLPLKDLAQFGLDQPKLKLKFDNEEFLFGTFNPVSSEQYVSYQDAVYLLPVSYAESAQSPVEEYLDKSPFKPSEQKQIAGFDFSRLEQWENNRLNVDLVDGKWKVSDPKAKPSQTDMKEWFDSYWRNISVQRVETYTPDRRINYPSFEVKLTDGKKVHLDKIQESPELLIGRPDEGVMYHVPMDVGFTLLNPPINTGK